MGRLADPLVELTVRPSALRSLQDELDTEWVPDPWGLADFHAGDTQLPGVADLESPLRLTVPFLGGRTRTVPLLDPWARLLFQQLATSAARTAEPLLRTGVCAYRLRRDDTIEHYRSALELRYQFENDLAEQYPLVLRLDIRSFFPSVRLELLDSVLPTTDGPNGLRALLSRFLDWFGYVLPEGYSASRALANTALVPVDTAVSSPFTRWVDDYHVFCRSDFEATCAEDGVQRAAAQLGLSLSEVKTRVLESKAAVDSANSSALGLHHSAEITDVANGYRDAPVSWSNDASAERRLRLALRLAADRRDDSLLSVLIEGGADHIPASALPRLAWLLAVAPWTDGSTDLVADLLDIDDHFRQWRAARLGAALWYAPTDVVAILTDTLEELMIESPVAQPILARVLARHRPNRLWDLHDLSTSASWNRAWSLAAAEAGGVRHPDLAVWRSPPVLSFL